jgi:hypothetical protein
MKPMKTKKLPKANIGGQLLPGSGRGGIHQDKSRRNQKRERKLFKMNQLDN